MKFLLYSAMNAETVVHNLGEPEYSYFFVLREFLPLLKTLGEVVLIANPALEVDQHYAEAQAKGEGCVFFSFTPPHLTCCNLACPTIPVFAWEFSSMPDETWWADRPENDWRNCLTQCGAAIVHSEQSVCAVRQIMGEDFPVISIPAPVWDRLESVRTFLQTAPVSRSQLLAIDRGVVFDTHAPGFDRLLPTAEEITREVAESRGLIPIESHIGYRRGPGTIVGITQHYLLHWYQQVVAPSLPASLLGVFDRFLERSDPWLASARQLELSGVVFTSLFNPQDGRKNWVDMLTAFCAAFKDEPNATLVFKLGHHRYEDAIRGILMAMSRLDPFQCRVVLLHGYLSGDAYTQLIEATHYIVNASYGEGQCLPLMEYLSCGKPAIAPRHSAMIDYIDESVGFVVDSWADVTAWPHDPRIAYRTLRQQIDWQSLKEAYRAAYRCVNEQPEHYQQLAQNAIKRMKKHCSRAVATERLLGFLQAEQRVAG
ncbi:glycosyltransferase [Pseudomonas sp. M30-35]|uniref:glycosyltransferase n=1 Tax=Pseudomonas sp. M30-35 TaxID=1981174 RepID=UPI000B3D22C0|nr:glycosyltransferase [Pseudomonas sp. M30-35]ARU86599.1 glycosyltransferase [Pseudomonas sp. M30-35]